MKRQRISKTMQALLDRAANNNGRFVVEGGHGNGPEGGRVSFGAREGTAARRLFELNLVRVIDGSHRTLTTNGWSIFIHTHRFELTARAYLFTANTKG